MAAGAAKWIWENSRASNGSLLVLLAIADECGEEESTEMSIAGLMRKTRLSDKGVRRAVKDLETLGELSVESRPGGVSRYAPSLTPVKMTGPDPGQNDRPVKTSPRSKRPDPSEEPQVSDTPVKMTGPEIPDALDLGSVVSGKRSKPSMSETPPRPDVERLCEHLADRIEANGSKRPSIGKRWKDDARLMLDKDGLTEEQVHEAIDYCQQHHFWHRNILSMEKLRKHIDRLRLDWKAEREKKAASGLRQQETDDLFDRAMERARQADAKEAGIDPRGNGSASAIHQGRIASAGN